MFKNLFKKNENGIKPEEALNQKLRYYEESIMPQFRKAWVDEDLMALTGTDDLFASNAMVKNKLSRDELFECYRRAHNMGQVPLLMLSGSKNAVENYVASNEKMRKQFADFMRKGKNGSGSFRYEGDLFVLNILNEVFREVEIQDDVDKYQADTAALSDAELLVKVNNALQGFRTGESLLARTLVLNLDLALMQNRLKDCVGRQL